MKLNDKINSPTLPHDPFQPPAPPPPFSAYIFNWAMEKNGNALLCQQIAERVLSDRGYIIFDPADKQNVSVGGDHKAKRCLFTVVCSAKTSSITIMVLHSISPDKKVADTELQGVRDAIKAIVIQQEPNLNPVHG